MCVTAAEKTDQRKSEEAFLKAARDGDHEAVTTMVMTTVHVSLFPHAPSSLSCSVLLQKKVWKC